MLDSRWTEILGNSDLINQISEIRDPEKLQELLKTNGYEFTLEEIQAAGEELSAQYAAQSDGEITESDLEDVAGGIRLGPTLMAAAARNAVTCTVPRCRRW